MYSYTPMDHGATPTQTVCARMRGERLADKFAYSETDGKQTTPYQHILELSMMRQLSTMMMMHDNAIQCCNALAAAPLKNILAFS